MRRQNQIVVTVLSALATVTVSFPVLALEAPGGGVQSVGGCSTNLDCDDDDPCTFDRCADGICDNSPAGFGDVAGGGASCGPDGAVSVFDIIVSFDAYLGIVPDGCDLSNLDVGGPGSCQADGINDLYDMLSVIDAFTGIDRCCHACTSDAECSDGRFCNGVETCEGTCRPSLLECPGQQCDENSESCVDSDALITCRLSTQTALPDRPVTLELFVESVEDLRGIQTAISVSRTAGTGELLCDGNCTEGAEVDREDFLFLNSPTGAVADAASGKAFAVVITPDSTASIGSDGAYFASYRFRVSPDAVLGSSFELSLLADPDTLLLGPAHDPIGFSIGAPCVLTVGMSDCDENGIGDVCDLDCGAAEDCNVDGCGLGVDCNGNNIPDACDIAGGHSDDCDANGVPDDCQPDCDENGVADVCDIADCDGELFCGDCNGNQVPDGCDIADGTSADEDDDQYPDECPTGGRSIFLSLRGRDPASALNTINLQPGGSYVFDVWVRESVVALSGYQVALDDASGGDAGALFYDHTARIDESRSGWLFAGVGTAFPVVDIGPPARLAAVVQDPADAVAAGEPRYLGHLTYTATSDACGVFTIEFLDPGTTEDVSQTVLFGPDQTLITLSAVSLTVKFGPTIYGDLDGSGRVDIFDILDVLDAFAGEFSELSLEDVDIAPCGGDGVIDLFDIFSVLDAFSGQPAPCPPEPCGETG